MMSGNTRVGSGSLSNRMRWQDLLISQARYSSIASIGMGTPPCCKASVASRRCLLRPADPGEVCEEPDAAVENHTEPVASGGVQLQCRGQVGWPVHEIGRRRGPCGPVAALLPVAALKGASFAQAFGQLVPEVRLRGVTVDR